MKFALVVPALNEEAAIAGTLRRCLAARAKVCAQTQVDEMVVVFVNDGSTDRTQEIVDQPEFADVVKVHFVKNRGYGAAIKAGFQATNADLVGFIDGDGTCEPDFCVQLINRMLEAKADVVLAARLNPDTQMPLIRKVGNRIFALLLGVMSGRLGITDTASGFRICRRDSLNLMSPLPDGLHFTPTQSAICLLDPRLKIEEVQGMHYKEREGRSKLHVVKDGFRFLWTILFSACCYAPIKTMLMASAAVAVLTAIPCTLIPLLVPAWGPSFFIGLTGVLVIMLLLGTGVVAHELNFLLIGPRRQPGPAERLLQSLLEYQRLMTTGAILAVLGALLQLVPFMPRGRETVWRTVLWFGGVDACVALTVLGIGLILIGVLIRIIWAVGEKQKALLADEYHVQALPPAKAARGGNSVAAPLSSQPVTSGK